MPILRAFSRVLLLAPASSPCGFVCVFDNFGHCRIVEYAGWTSSSVAEIICQAHSSLRQFWHVKGCQCRQCLSCLRVRVNVRTWLLFRLSYEKEFKKYLIFFLFTTPYSIDFWKNSRWFSVFHRGLSSRWAGEGSGEILQKFCFRSSICILWTIPLETHIESVHICFVS